MSVLRRFASRQAEADQDLYPMLTAAERPTVEVLIARVEPLLETLGRTSPAHREYLRLLAEEHDFRPELLFGDSAGSLEAARASPRMEWKLQNLRARDA